MVVGRWRRGIPETNLLCFAVVDVSLVLGRSPHLVIPCCPHWLAGTENARREEGEQDGEKYEQKKGILSTRRLKGTNSGSMQLASRISSIKK